MKNEKTETGTQATIRGEIGKELRTMLDALLDANGIAWNPEKGFVGEEGEELGGSLELRRLARSS
jgi:hypothetical protein